MRDRSVHLGRICQMHQEHLRWANSLDRAHSEWSGPFLTGEELRDDQEPFWLVRRIQFWDVYSSGTPEFGQEHLRLISNVLDWSETPVFGHAISQEPFGFVRKSPALKNIRRCSGTSMIGREHFCLIRKTCNWPQISVIIQEHFRLVKNIWDQFLHRSGALPKNIVGWSKPQYGCWSWTSEARTFSIGQELFLLVRNPSWLVNKRTAFDQGHPRWVRDRFDWLRTPEIGQEDFQLMRNYWGTFVIAQEHQSSAGEMSRNTRVCSGTYLFCSGTSVLGKCLH